MTIRNYKHILPLLLSAAMSPFSACTDDFGHDASSSDGYMSFSVNVPGAWHSGMAAAGPEGTRGCVRVAQFDGDVSDPLYLHSASGQDTLRTAIGTTRGHMVNSKNDFHDAFSLSAICFTGTYPSDEAENKWTPNFAYDIKYDKSGKRADGGGDLQWPGAGAKIKFFAFAPHISLMPENSLSLSSADSEGSPTLTYTVPQDVTDQKDLMVAVADAGESSHSVVTLNFDHLLTSVQVKASEDMIKCKITKVTLSGIYGKGTYNMGSKEWTSDGTPSASFSASWGDGKIMDSGGENEDIGTGTAQPVVDGDMTFLLLPQKLSDKSILTIELSDIVSGEKYVISAPVGKEDGSLEWTPGSKWRYTVSASSISVEPFVEIYSGDKKIYDSAAAAQPATDSDVTDNFEMPYTGVLYGATIRAYARIIQDGKEEKVVYPDPSSLILRYRTKGTSGNHSVADFSDMKWIDGNDKSKGFRGTLALKSGSPLESAGLQTGCVTAETGTASSPIDLVANNGNETANCYMIDQAGFYSFPLVYGNALKGGAPNTPAYSRPTATQEGITYFVKHDNTEITDPYITGAEEAILIWQDSPDLVQDVRLKDNRVQFHIDGRTIAPGNALIAVRDKDGTILWSWHIWVTTSGIKNGWLDKTKHRVVATDTDENTHEYFLTPTNLGYSSPREAQPRRDVEAEITLRIPASDTGYKDRHTSLTLEKKFHIAQAKIEKSMAGDNPYYQWGRKDPLPPGIYYSKDENDYVHGVSPSNVNNIRRKPLFNVYPGYESTRTPESTDNGVDIGYAIQHPHQHVLGTDPSGQFDYRKHWHNAGSNGYISADHIMFNIWNASATSIGESESNNVANFQEVTKTIYDPCPAGFHIPPGGVFIGLAGPGSSSSYKKLLDTPEPSMSADKTVWTVMDADRKEMKFYAVGVRDMNLKKTVLDGCNDSNPVTGFIPDYHTHSWCSFREISYITSSTLYHAPQANQGYQTLIFIIDTRQTKPQNGVPTQPFGFASCVGSINSYGLSVRPAHDLPAADN